MSNIEQFLARNGNNVIELYDKEYNSKNYAIAKIKLDDKFVFVCFTTTDYRYVYEIDIYNDSSNSIDSILEVISSIIDNAEYHEELEGQFYYHAPIY